MQGVTQATGCAMLVRCSTLRHVGLLDEQFWIYAEDLDWSVRFVKKGYRIAFAPKSHLWHLDGATNVKALGSGSQAVRQFLSSRNMVLVMRKHVRWWQLPTYIWVSPGITSRITLRCGCGAGILGRYGRSIEALRRVS